jgi:DNA sulfur modification protein DndD
MYLRKIYLRDWKSYANETVLTFPRPTKNKNVVLIGAKNGYGKTSLLEALVIGLYGRDGLRMVARAESTGDDTRLALNYSQFLERAFHSRALAEGRSNICIKLTFGEDGEEDLTVERVWYFSSSGRHRPGDDELRLWVGDEENPRPRRAPPLQDDDDFARGEIAKAALPSHLAEFFLFDGEQVQRLARKDMAAQVRQGIEGLLGAVVLRELRDDLEKYAERATTNTGATAEDVSVTELQAEVDRLEDQQATTQRNVGELERQVASLSAERDDLTSKFSGSQAGGIATVRELQAKKSAISNDLANARERLTSLLLGEFALGLTGRELRERALNKLKGELTLHQWTASVATTRARLNEFLEAIEAAAPEFSPPLTAEQKAALDTRLQSAWQSLWHPPPADCAQSIEHDYLSDQERERIRLRLLDLEKLGLGTIEQLLGRIESNEQDDRKLQRQIAEFTGVEDHLQGIADRIREIQPKIDSASADLLDKRRALETLTGQLSARRAELGRALKSRERSAPERRRTEVAKKVATMLGDLLEEAMPLYTADLAVKMTEAYKALAHKSVVNEVRIDAQCNVELFTRRGERIRDLDASAGENQIFSFALISAIARATELQFPIVIDTPLARLDEEHRLRILRHFGERAGEQIIFLTQDTEIVGRYFKEIEDRVAKRFLVEHKQLGEHIGRSVVRPDQYFA